MESASIPDTEYSFHSEEHADIHIHSMVSSHYSKPTTHPITGNKLFLDDVIENDDSGTESESELSSVDPACMVIPTSSKAFSGVARHKDFIRCLPVHLAKYILKLLDKTSLSHALLVSQNWRALVLEVHDEERINQLLEEDVMLMQVRFRCNTTVIHGYRVSVKGMRIGTGKYLIRFLRTLLELYVTETRNNFT